MLEAVGFPVAVNPETRLAAIARKRGWLVEQWSKAPGGPRPLLPDRAAAVRSERRAAVRTPDDRPPSVDVRDRSPARGRPRTAERCASIQPGDGRQRCSTRHAGKECRR